MTLMDWTVVAAMAVSYIAGTLFGYAVAFRRGRREGIALSLASFISLGYIKTSINRDGEVMIHKIQEDTKTHNE